MLRILGSTKTLCDGVTRRDMLRIGGLGLLGSGLAPFPKTDASAAAEPDRGAHFGKAKRVILLYLYGAAAQHELWDLKPEAPDEIRSTFQPIDTVVPGIQVCEHLPNIAGVADKCCFIRSMTHPYNIHSAAYTLTGIDKVDIPMELNPYDIRNWPFFGSVLEYIHQQQNPDSPAQHRPAVSVQRAGHGLQTGRALCRFSRARVQPGLDRFRRKADPQHQTLAGQSRNGRGRPVCGNRTRLPLHVFGCRAVAA
jgi:hypothetical protein